MILSQHIENYVGCTVLQVYLFNINGYVIAGAYMFPEDDEIQITEGI